MAKAKRTGNNTKKKPIEQYAHKGEKAGEKSAGRIDDAPQ